MVFEGYTGKGIATAIVHTLQLYSFIVWGFDRVYIEMDSSNRASMKVAQKLGYTFFYGIDTEWRSPPQS